MNMAAVGGRKLIVTLIMAIIGLGLTYLYGDIPSGFLTFMQTIFGAFVLGNVLEDVSRNVSDASVKRKQVESQSTPADGVYLDAKLTSLENKISRMDSDNKEVLAQVNGSLSTLQQAISFIIDRAGFKK